MEQKRVKKEENERGESVRLREDINWPSSSSSSTSSSAADRGTAAARVQVPSAIHPCTGDLVLLAIDHSKQAELAFEWYLKNLHRKDNLVIAVHALALPNPSGINFIKDVYEEMRRKCLQSRQELHNKYRQKFEENKVSGCIISDTGQPGEFIVEEAIKNEATYVVTGTRGFGLVKRTLLGSVSDHVIHHSTCPVCVCKLSS